MGPRNRRRLAIGGSIAAVTVAVVVAAVLLTRSPSHSPDASATRSSGSGESYFDDGPRTGKLVYGMTTQQVLRIDGRRAKVVRYQGLACWQYTVNQTSPAVGQFPATTLNAERVCFDDGRYSIAHDETDGKWDSKVTPVPP